MADLYDRLEEIQGMTRILTADVAMLRPLLGERSIQTAETDTEKTNRRFYVRAVFALIEAVVEQHKRLLLELSNGGAITLAEGIFQALSEQVYIVRKNGTVTERNQYLQIERKLRAVYRAAGDAFGQPLTLDFGNIGWESFRAALDVRDRLTHPKTFSDCLVNEDDLDKVDKGHEWFREVNNEFVRVVRKHRANHNW